MTGFSGLTNAMTALNAASYGLDVTGQNISNASTPGYVRQRAELAETGQVAGAPSMYATQNPNSTATISGTSRLNDPVVDMRARAEHGLNGYAQTQSSTLSSVESLFNEPSDTGLAEQLNGFWKSWGAVANNPGNPAARGVVLQNAASLAANLNASSAALGRITQSVTQQATAVAGQINTAAGTLAQLNGAIAVASASGTNANSLLNQRDSLLMNLSDLTGAQATIGTDGTATVTIGGQALVTGSTANAVTIGSGNTILVGGNQAGTAGGNLQSLVDSLNSTLPNYANQLDAVAAALANTANTAQQGGYDLNGNPGGALFTGNTAATISVAVTDPSTLAASGTPGGNLDGSVALAMSGLGTAIGGPDLSYQSFIGALGTAVQSATQQATVQQSVTTSVDNLAQSSSGVSIDEETTKLLTYQRAYQASSRVLTTVDETLDTLISHTGHAGLA